MVSEGVDVPRLSVGVYATNASTPLFFAQAIGRFVRARKRGESASVFLPNVPILMKLAEQLELERDHALDRETTDDDPMGGLDDGALDEANRLEKASESLALEGSFQALSSDANFDRVLYDGGEFGFEAEVGSEEELDFLGLPGLLEPDQVRDLLKHRQAKQSRGRKATPPAKSETTSLADIPMHRRLKEQRQRLQDLVGLWSHRTNTPHGAIHAELRRMCGGPAVAQATEEELQKRIDLLRKRVKG
jgi:hypothetical protein